MGRRMVSQNAGGIVVQVYLCLFSSLSVINWLPLDLTGDKQISWLVNIVHGYFASHLKSAYVYVLCN